MYQEPMEGKLMLRRKHDLFLKAPDYFTYSFLNYKDAQKEASLLGIKSGKAWHRYCMGTTMPHNIPRWPEGFYKNSGWIDWYHWLHPSEDSKNTSCLITS